jgi:hypothetical protein
MRFFMTRFGPAFRFGWMTALALVVAQSSSGGTREADEKRTGERISGVRIPFIANSGQTDPAVAYYAPTFAGTVFVTRDGRIVYSLPGKKASAAGGRSSVKGEARPGWSLTETAVGAEARPNGVDRASTGVSYFHGNDPARWRTGVPTFEGVSLGEVWPGISLELRARGKNVEKLFTIAPGADPSRIRMSMVGARRLSTDRTGALIASTGLGDVTFTPPAAYQERHGVRRSVKVVYELRGRQYGFRLDGYDPDTTVVIDPLLQATYLGGSADDGTSVLSTDLAIHPVSGDVYVAGFTQSANFPGTAGGAQPAFGGPSFDAFVGRFDAGLTTLKQATYLGGGFDDQAYSLAIHPASGDVYVAGATASTDFPGTAGGAQTAMAGCNDGFVARLNPALTTLKQSTYLGGSACELAFSLAFHTASGDVYIGGATSSSDFPGTAGGAQTTNAGAEDGFVARLNANLTALAQATYLGGTGSDEAFGLTVHPTSGDVYAVGITTSTDFPGTAGGAQPGYGGGSSDGFVARLNGGLTTLTQATYLGGSDSEDGQELRIHPASGDVYAGGSTRSTDFPGTTGGAQAASGGSDDLFVARLNVGLTTIKQATYFGGSGQEFRFALAIHSTSGEVYIGGVTGSGDLPNTGGGAQPVDGGDYDGFIVRFNEGLTTVNQATFLGGSSSDSVEGLAIHPTSGDVYAAGFTTSTDFPGAAGGAQPAVGGLTDAFVARLTADLAGGPPKTLTALSPAKVWVGLKNSDDVVLRLDLLAEVFVNSTKVGEGQLNNVNAGSSGFDRAVLNTIPLGLTGGPATIPSSAAFRLKISARRTCFGAGHNSGTARLWYNGQPIDSGATRDAGTRFDATIDASTSNYFARENFALRTAAGSSKLSVDAFVNSAAPCPGRPFKEIRTWSMTLP